MESNTTRDGQCPQLHIKSSLVFDHINLYREATFIKLLVLSHLFPFPGNPIPSPLSFCFPWRQMPIKPNLVDRLQKCTVTSRIDNVK